MSNALQKFKFNELLHHNESKDIIDLLHSEVVFPFNIKNLNYRLFLNHKESVSFSNKDHELLKQIKNKPNEYEIFYKNIDFWKDNKLEKIINVILENIVNSTNINLPIFNHEKGENFTILRHDAGNAFNEDHIENMNFNVNVNENSSLYQVIKKFKISVTLNKVSQRVSGGFILDFNWLKSMSFNDSVDMIYLFNLFNQNILTHLMPLSMDSIVDIINDVSFKHEHEKNEPKHVHFKELTRLNTIIDFKNVSFDSLHALWINILEKNFLHNHEHKFSKEKNNYLKDDFFYALIFMLCVNIYFLFELNSILTSNDKFGYLDKNQLSNNLVYPEENDKFSIEEYTNNLLHMIHKNYLHNGSIFKTPYFINKKYDKKVINQDIVSLKDLKINYMLSSPSVIYSFKLRKFKNIFHIEELLNDDEYLALFLMILFPESYLLNINDKNLFPDLNLIYQYINYLTEMDKVKFRKEIKSCLCENNYYYYSFIRNDSVILLENNCYDQKSSITLDRISYYYLVSVCFVHSRINELKELQKISNYLEFTDEIKWKNIPYHKLLRDLNDLDFDLDSADLFSNEKLKPLINKLDQDYHLKHNLHTEQDKVRWSDELFKRGFERSNFIIFFMVAILVGFINYFGQVYSETTDTNAVGGGGPYPGGQPGVDINFPWIPMTLSFATLAEISMLIILGYAFYRMIYFRLKIKWIDEHKIQLF